MKNLMGRMGLMGLMVAAAALGAGALLCGSGCTTTTVKPVPDPYDPNVTRLATNTVTTLDTNAVIEVIEAAVPTVVRLAVQKDSNAGPYFQQVSLVLRAAAASGQYDVASITNSLSRISIRELRTPNAVLAEEAALSIYKTFLAGSVDKQIDKVAWVRPVLIALADAIKAGTE